MPLGEGKKQTNTGLDDRMRSWIDWTMRAENASLAIVIGAGVAALFSLSDRDRKCFLRWANLIDSRKVTWEQFAEAARQSESERRQILQRLVGAEPFVVNGTDRKKTKK